MVKLGKVVAPSATGMLKEDNRSANIQANSTRPTLTTQSRSQLGH